MSIDGVGAYDLMSLNAMFEGLLQMEGGDQFLPFVRCFYGSPSPHLWGKRDGCQSEHSTRGGERQGDLFMPMLFALGQHTALEAIQARMRVGDHVFAYLDNIYTGPESTVWNRGGTEPSGLEAMTRATRVLNEVRRSGERMVTGSEGDDPVACFNSVREVQQAVLEAGLEMPQCQELADNPPHRDEEPEPNLPKVGWQQQATMMLEQNFVRERVWPALSDSTRAVVCPNTDLWPRFR